MFLSNFAEIVGTPPFGALNARGVSKYSDVAFGYLISSSVLVLNETSEVTYTLQHVLVGKLSVNLLFYGEHSVMLVS